MSQDYTLDIQLSYTPKQDIQYGYTKQHVRFVKTVGPHIHGADGKIYLDCFDVSSTVGYCNAEVNAAVATALSMIPMPLQPFTATTVKLTSALQDRLPKQLNKFFFTNSKSEAMDLAIMLAQYYTRQTDCVVVDGARHGYHGLGAFVSTEYISRANTEKQQWVHVLPFSVPYVATELATAGKNYIKVCMKEIEMVAAKGRKIAAFITEPIFTYQGVIIPPLEWLPCMAKCVRRLGGLLIVDEAHTGLGRMGDSFWGYELSGNEGAVPDILVVGETISNGISMGVVVTTTAIGERFPPNLIEADYLGNEAACAAAVSVLRILKETQMIALAQKSSNTIFNALVKAKERCPFISAVRRQGLNFAIEISATRRKTVYPSDSKANEFLAKLKMKHHIITGIFGKHKNVILLLLPYGFVGEEFRMVRAFEDVFRVKLTDVVMDIPFPFFGEEEPGPSHR